MAPTVHLVSVNIGALQPVTADRPRSRTGIFKQPVHGAIALHALGLAGDRVGNTRLHGGPDKAVYLYSAEDYAWWSDTLGYTAAPGLFGDNLTIDAWWPDARTGDQLQIGDVTLELTTPRLPCATLAARMGEPAFVTRFADAARPGAYARVLEPGAIEAGSTGRVVRAAGETSTIAEAFARWCATRARRASPAPSSPTRRP